MSAISWSGTSSRLGRGATWNATSDRDRTSISAPVTRSTSVTGSPAGSAAAGDDDEASLAHGCATFRACRRWLESLGLAHPEHLFNCEHDICYCDKACESAPVIPRVQL